MVRRPIPIRVTARDRIQLQKLLRGGIQPVRVVLRALALRLLADGVTAPQTAQSLQSGRPQSEWGSFADLADRAVNP